MQAQTIALQNNTRAILRSVCFRELRQLTRIQKQSFGLVTLPLPRKILEHAFNIVQYRVMTIEDTIVGYIGLQQLSKEQTRVNVIAVHPDKQHLGLGRALLCSAHQNPLYPDTKYITLNVRTSNHKALRLYQGLGYRILHTRLGYYHRPREHAYVMQKTLG